MNVTFLIGNGFDLNLGLNTLYSHFIKDYKIPGVEDSPIIKSFKEQIDNNEKAWSNAEEEFGNLTTSFTGNTGRNLFLTCHDHFCRGLGNYLAQEQKRVPFSQKKENVLSFAKSLQSFYDGFRTVTSTKIQETIRNLPPPFKFNFLCFNYTTTLDQCISLARANSNLLGKQRNFSNALEDNIHVHGFYNRDMALGLNDETQIKNPSLFEGAYEEDKAQIIKKETNRINEQRTDERATKILNASDIIYIYGMSLGNTDKLWWERIGALLLKNPALRVIIYCHDAPSDEMMRQTFLRFERDMKQKLLRFNECAESKLEEVYQRIHVTNKNIFSGLKNLAQEPALI